MNIFISGQKGLIGWALKRRLMQEGHTIVGMADLRDGTNILKLKNLRTNLKIDLFIHLAAYCKINKTIEEPNLANSNNSEGTFQVLEFCRRNKIPRIMFFSSSRTLNKEKNVYTASKVYGEELCKAYAECYGIEYLIIRPSTVYGPFWDKTQRLMHLFIVAALKNKDLKIYGNPKTKTLDFSYIEDFVDAVMLSLNGKWNEDYEISGEEEFKVFDLAKYIIEKTNSKSEIKVYDQELAQPQEVKVDISKIKKLGYQPKIKVKEGVKRTIQWYQNFLQTKAFQKKTRKGKNTKIIQSLITLALLVSVGLGFFISRFLSS